MEYSSDNYQHIGKNYDIENKLLSLLIIIHYFQEDEMVQACFSIILSTVYSFYSYVALITHKYCKKNTPLVIFKYIIIPKLFMKIQIILYVYAAFLF